VTEKLLDRPEVGPTFDQMGRVGVPEPVRVPDESAQVARVEATPADREEERVGGAPGQDRACVAEVPAHQCGCLLSDRYDAVLPALAFHVDGLLLDVDVAEVEAHRLRASEPARVDELDQRPVAHSQCTLGRHPVHHRLDLLLLGGVRQPPASARGHDRFGHPAGTEGEAQKRAHRGDPPRDGCRGQTATCPPDLARVRGDNARVHVVESVTGRAKPTGEIPQVGCVGAPRRIGQAPAREKPLDGRVDIHMTRFRARRRAPAEVRTLTGRMPVIAHLSDIHLGDQRAEDRFEAVISHLSAMASPPDALLITGDVLDFLESELIDLREPAGAYADVGRRLAALGVPVIACPGNHDDGIGFRLLFGLAPAGGPFNSRLDIDGLTIIACDTSVRGAPWGRLTEETLRWLEGELAASHGPTLLALHHTPATIGVPLIDAIRLREPEPLERLVRATPTVVGVVCGHAHTAAVARFADRPLVVCPALSSTILLDRETGPQPIFDRDVTPGFVFHLIDGLTLTTHLRYLGVSLPGIIHE
jgi:3',5'-cyclic-AMP phosphodiesterase